MQNTTSWLFFIIFALVLVVMYLGVRRRWLSPALIAAVGVLINIVMVTLFGLAQGNPLPQAVAAGFIVGGLFSAATLAVAYYFQRAEARQGQ